MSEAELNRVRGYGDNHRPASVTELLEGSPFIGYGYAYPHKTAYRSLAEPRSLTQLWAQADTSALFLYVHVPFCAVRCGFCNLFTQKHPPEQLPWRWLETLERQIEVVHEAVPDARFARWAFGGGTPTLLEAEALERLCTRLERTLGVDLGATPGSVETSPETCTDARLAVLAERGATRVSIGVQSFFEPELRALGRPQAVHLAEAALDRIRAHPIANLNLDLIYGIAGQTEASFVAAIDRALDWAPEQLYLYPLYQRPLTGLGRRERSWDDHRLGLLRAGRDHLLTAGYEQVSMRMFAKPSQTPGPSPRYSCQNDGMLGFGVGARSYTPSLHYSDDWAVGGAGIRDIVGSWIDRPSPAFGEARYGVELDGEEQRRRYLIQSLLWREGLSRPEYQARFGTAVERDFALELEQLCEQGLLAQRGELIQPTTRGFEWADAIAPWLYSDAVRAASRDFELR